jgi:O-antigen/teichoic acid export membrane protein
MTGPWTRALPRSLRSRLEGSPTLQRIVPNAGWMVADRLVRMALGLVVGAWVARYLGPPQFGAFNFALAFVALFSPLATLGLERIVVRDLVDHPDRTPDILGSAFLIRMAGGCVTLALSVAVVAWLRPGDPLAVALVAVMAAASVVQALDVIDLWFQSGMRARHAVVATGTAFLVAAVLRMTLILMRAPLIAFAWAALVEMALAGVGLVLVYRGHGGRLSTWRWSGERARALVADGWPLMLSSVMILIYLRIDQVMLGQMASAAELGAYSAAVKLVEVWYFVPTTLVAAVFPSIVEARRLGEQVFYQRLQQLYNAMAIAAYAVALPTCLLARGIVVTVFGDAYASAGPMLAVLVWSILFTNLGVARSSFLTTMNMTRPYFVTVALGAVVNVALNLLLIPRWGGMGAVIASCAAYWLAAHGSCYLYPPLVRTGNMLTRAMLAPRL